MSIFVRLNNIVPLLCLEQCNVHAKVLYTGDAQARMQKKLTLHMHDLKDVHFWGHRKS